MRLNNLDKLALDDVAEMVRALGDAVESGMALGNAIGSGTVLGYAVESGTARGCAVGSGSVVHLIHSWTNMGLPAHAVGTQRANFWHTVSAVHEPVEVADADAGMQVGSE